MLASQLVQLSKAVQEKRDRSDRSKQTTSRMDTGFNISVCKYYDNDLVIWNEQTEEQLSSIYKLVPPAGLEGYFLSRSLRNLRASWPLAVGHHSWMCCSKRFHMLLFSVPWLLSFKDCVSCCVNLL